MLCVALCGVPQVLRCACSESCVPRMCVAFERTDGVLFGVACVPRRRHPSSHPSTIQLHAGEPLVLVLHQPPAQHRPQPWISQKGYIGFAATRFNFEVVEETHGTQIDTIQHAPYHAPQQGLPTRTQEDGLSVARTSGPHLAPSGCRPSRCSASASVGCTRPPAATGPFNRSMRCKKARSEKTTSKNFVERGHRHHHHRHLHHHHHRSVMRGASCVRTNFLCWPMASAIHTLPVRPSAVCA